MSLRGIFGERLYRRRAGPADAFLSGASPPPARTDFVRHIHMLDILFFIINRFQLSSYHHLMQFIIMLHY